MPKVVVVDDDKMDRYLITQSILSFDEASEVFEVADSRDAVTVCGDLGADVVLLDISMPLMDGFAVLADLREKIGDELQVYILSGSTRLQDRIHAQRLNADGYLVKPHSLVEYRSLAKTLFSAIGTGNGFLSNIKRIWQDPAGALSKNRNWCFDCKGFLSSASLKAEKA